MREKRFIAYGRKGRAYVFEGATGSILARAIGLTNRNMVDEECVNKKTGKRYSRCFRDYRKF